MRVSALVRAVLRRRSTLLRVASVASRHARVLVASAGLLLMCLALTLMSPYFLTVPNVLNVLRQASIIAILSVGMTYAILTGGIDLSVGSVLAFSSVVSAVLMKSNFPLVPSLAAALCTGALCGAVSGALIIGRMRMPPFISTLATMSIARGLTMVITGGMPIYGLPSTFAYIGAGYVLGIPVPVVIMAVVYLLACFDLALTRSGVYHYAVGGNEEAARLAGIDTRAVKLRAYVISGITAAISGLVLASRITSVEPLSGLGYELDAIASAVIGGVSLSGGEGSVLGTLIGALIMGVLRNGLNLLDVSTYWQQVVIGVVIAVTVSLAAPPKK